MALEGRPRGERLAVETRAPRCARLGALMSNQGGAGDLSAVAQRAKAEALTHQHRYA